MEKQLTFLEHSVGVWEFSVDAMQNCTNAQYSFSTSRWTLNVIVQCTPP